MEKADNELSLQAFGALVTVITRSSPAAIIFWFYVVFSFISLWTGLAAIWMTSSLILGAILLLLLIFKPDRLWSERHIQEMRKMDLKHLGDKKNPQIDSRDYSELYRPVEVIEGQKKK